MPTTIKNPKKYQRPKATIKTNTDGRLILEAIDNPHAGSGACKAPGCTCKKFIFEGHHAENSTTNILVAFCGNCGHKEGLHS